jgi:mannose/fructose-specific phosphotransferase system component IIA
VSNSGLGRDALEQAVLQAVDGHPAVIFVDLPSGSCLFAAMRQLPSHPQLRVVTGVNLVMLLEFLLHHEQSPEEIAKRAADSGVKGIGSR